MVSAPTVCAGLGGAIVFGWLGGLITLTVFSIALTVVLMFRDRGSGAAFTHPGAAFGIVGIPVVALPGAAVIAATQWLTEDTRTIAVVAVVACIVASIPLAFFELAEPRETIGLVLPPVLVGLLIAERSLTPPAAAALLGAAFAAAALASSSFAAHWLDRAYLTLTGRIPVHLLTSVLRAGNSELRLGGFTAKPIPGSPR